ncbi:ParB/RepB/Spo0J family partition protein [Deinococcus multiflagellatus]|uniref:ParB/RepB/Spo0J family partition protein n=1 Tax=Deinococcus multiflagellatus TaxID=1656887 RepID=A0ABW1ZQR2_9DEIO|nr:ParB/RepB/Spo0J family partition protein [Deinococcus multiflagellatus]MBZ9715914.1 ParB/RepB/Spo0J family partition protein [Deinococcus multiflagellatus]
MTRKRPERHRDLKGLLGEDLGPLRQREDTPSSTLPVAQLRPGTGQPRRDFDEARLQALADSIRAEGVLQPLLVRPVEGGFEIVAGERRWRAAQRAGLTEVPVLIRTLDDRQARVAALVENLQRDNLNVIDEVDGKLALVALALNLDPEPARARLIQLLAEEPGPDHALLDEVFAPLGESWASFAKNKLRVLRWPAELVDALRAGLPLTLGGVIAAAPAEHHAALIALAQGGASRTELRAEVERLTAQAKAAPSRAALAGRRLTSARFMARLSTEDRQAVERWLARMPAVLTEE